MIDVIERLQKAETRPLDADGKTQLWETLQDARAEIARLRDALDEQTGRAAWHYECLTQCEERVIQRDAQVARLRLTDAERDLVERLAAAPGEPVAAMEVRLTPQERKTARGLLERMGGER